MLLKVTGRRCHRAMVYDPAVGEMSRSAHLDKIELNTVIAALVFCDDASNGCKIEDLTDRRGLSRADDLKERRPPLGQAIFGDAMTLWRFIRYTR